MTKVKKQQEGFLSWTVILVLVTFSFVLMCFFKLGPHYLDNSYIHTAMKSLAKEYPNLHEVPKETIQSELGKFMIMNNVRGQEANSFTFTRKSDRLLINNIYEVRVPFFLNIDVMLTFYSQLDSANPEACCALLDETVLENTDK